jgi:hypothetical protein
MPDGRLLQVSYRLYESAGYLGSHPAFDDFDDFDALRLWAVKHNDWKGVRTGMVNMGSATSRTRMCRDLAR